MRIGTIGTGFIVETFLSALNDINDAEAIAVYSRSQNKGQKLADKFNIKKVYNNLDIMLKDNSIDFIYLASPNSLHYKQALKALKKGKNVICEKPFTSTLEEADELINIAKANKLMLFEAITTIHMPNYKSIKKSINTLGKIKLIQCNYSQYSSRYDKLLAGEVTNVFNPEFSGGALQDINIYNLHFVMNIFGSPDSVNYIANKHVNGIDTSGIMILKYPSFICELVGAKDTDGMNFVLIQGEDGYLHVHQGANGCKKFSIYLKNEEFEINKQKPGINRLYYEIKEFLDIYKRNDFKECYDLLDYSRSVVKVVVNARKDGGIVFDADMK